MATYNKYYFSVFLEDTPYTAVTSGLKITVINASTKAEAAIKTDSSGATALTNSITSTVFNALGDGVVEFYSAESSLDVMIEYESLGITKYVSGITPRDNRIVLRKELPFNMGIVSISSVEYAVPEKCVLSVGTAEVTSTDHDTADLGETTIVTGSAANDILIPDYSAATVGRCTAIVNYTSNNLLVDRTDSTNNKINNGDFDITLTPNGWVLLCEVANDSAIVLDGYGFSLTAD